MSLGTVLQPQTLFHDLTLSRFPCRPPISWNALLFSFTGSYSSAHILNTCLVLQSPYICLLHILIHNLTVLYALMTFTSVSLAEVSLLSPHIPLLLESSILIGFYYFPWKTCITSMIQQVVQTGNLVVIWPYLSPSLPKRYHHNERVLTA